MSLEKMKGLLFEINYGKKELIHDILFFWDASEHFLQTTHTLVADRAQNTVTVITCVQKCMIYNWLSITLLHTMQTHLSLSIMRSLASGSCVMLDSRGAR